jgi:hypothetical protein
MFSGGGPVFKGTVYALEDLNSVPGNHRDWSIRPVSLLALGPTPLPIQLRTIFLSYIHPSIYRDAIF